MNLRFWKTETRATDYTEQVIAAALAQASGKAADSGALASVEAAVGFIARSLSTATVTPASNLTAAVTPSFLQLVGRRLSKTGNFVALIEVQGGGVTFIPATSYDVSGDADPATWAYRLSLGGPSRERTVRTSAVSVVHFRINAEFSWRGRSPLQIAAATGRLGAQVEKSLALEQSFLPSRVALTDASGDEIGHYAKELAAGGVITQGAIDPTDKSGGLTRLIQKIGPAPDGEEVTLRSNVQRSILSAFGLSPSMFESGSDGTSQRESFRRAYTTTLNPLAMMIAQELSEKLESPVTLSLNEIRASDEQGRARGLASRAAAFKIFVTEGKMTTDAARELAGL